MAYGRTTNRSRARRPMRRRATRSRYTRKARTSRRPKRRTYRKRATRTQLNSETAQQLAVTLNPFSTATEQPKIPDGSRNHSLGVSMKCSGVITGSDTNNDGWSILLYPGRRTFGVIYPGKPGTGPGLISNTWLTRPDPLTYGPDPNGWSDEESLDAWRTVSLGLKLRDISASEKNNGWWCAIRYRPRCSDGKVKIYETDGSNDKPALVSLPAYTSWANDPTYSSGSLKTLGMKNFVLCPENSELEWTADKADPNLDIIVIHLRGGGAENILYNLSCNQETSYQTKSELNKYQTQCQQVMPATLAAVQIKRRYMCKKAAS